jgi:hypothetical protein
MQHTRVSCDHICNHWQQVEPHVIVLPVDAYVSSVAQLISWWTVLAPLRSQASRKVVNEETIFQEMFEASGGARMGMRARATQKAKWERTLDNSATTTTTTAAAADTLIQTDTSTVQTHVEVVVSSTKRSVAVDSKEVTVGVKRPADDASDDSGEADKPSKEERRVKKAAKRARKAAAVAAEASP